MPLCNLLVCLFGWMVVLRVVVVICLVVCAKVTLHFVTRNTLPSI